PLGLIVNYGFQEETYLLLVRIGVQFSGGKVCSFQAEKTGIKIVGAVVSDVSGGEIQVKVNNDGESIIPENFELQQNYPNPFNAATTIRYGLPLNADDVEVTIYDVLGRKVRTLTQERVIAGFHQVVWDGKGERGVTVASGVYFYRLKVRMDKTTRFIATNKMLLIK
ncbi:MAG: FlgD immunoglobulin-like domain containing protein, partial [Ignavibacteria bacterium]|nr:FlgD immunoglobulin-like domain containing protein [Ignavibacteria bacterium]